MSTTTKPTTIETKSAQEMGEAVQAAAEAAEITRAKVPIICGKFSGHLAAFAMGAYNYFLAYGVDSKAAHKLANDYAGDVGRAMKEDTSIASKVNKANKDGESIIAFKGKTEGIKQTPTMSLVRIMTHLETLKKPEGLFAKRPEIASLDLYKPLRETLDTADYWATMQTWKE